MTTIGISGMAAAVPSLRVDLQNWCQWRGNNWSKVREIVGSGYRILAPDQNVYTLAATAAARLIENYDIDPRRIGFLALGTESSTDNSAGAIIIKGMLDLWTDKRGLPRISRHCEVPEFKHACLGGMYAMKGALRYLATDGRDRLALVISADTAEYAPGSTGEPTQGAGAVAMLLDRDARLATMDPDLSGSAACYRGADFRKPFSRFLQQPPNPNRHISDFPLFNGKYSTYCYVDEVLVALEDMFTKRGIQGPEYFRGLPAVFLHRPYYRLPRTAWGMAYLFALGKGNRQDLYELHDYCAIAGVDPQMLAIEMATDPDLFHMAQRQIVQDPYPLTAMTLQALRDTDAFRNLVTQRMQLGDAVMAELGNLYTAALPAWMAAAMEESLAGGQDATGEEWLAVGYGSGDAAEAMPMWISPGWQDAAARIGMANALANPVDISKEQYENLHATGVCEGLDGVRDRLSEFVITRRGDTDTGPFIDSGLEYYDYVSA